MLGWIIWVAQTQSDADQSEQTRSSNKTTWEDRLDVVRTDGVTEKFERHRQTTWEVTRRRPLS